MKTSPASSPRRLLASAGAVLGMLATVGLAAPAQAAVLAPSATSVVQNDRHDDHGKNDHHGNNNDGNRNYNTGYNWNNNNDNHRNNYNNDNHRNNYNNDNHRNNYNNDNHRNNNWGDWNNHNNHNDADLYLRVDRDGDYRIRGNDYEDNRVKVTLRDVSRGRTVDSFTVYPNHNGDFTVHGDDLRCNRTYQAVSWSNDDGRDYSNKVRLHCDHK